MCINKNESENAQIVRSLSAVIIVRNENIYVNF